MNLNRLGVAIVIAGFLTSAHGQGIERGICDSSGQREKRTAEYNVEARQDTASAFVATLACSEETISIKQCAVIEVKKTKVQRYCYRKDRPVYYEYVDIVEYWDTP